MTVRMCGLKQKEGPPTCRESRAGLTKKLHGKHRRAHWQIASNRSRRNPKVSNRLTTFAGSGVSNGAPAMMKPVAWDVGTHRNRGSKDRSGGPADGSCFRREVAIEFVGRTGLDECACASAAPKVMRRDVLALSGWDVLSMHKHPGPTKGHTSLLLLPSSSNYQNRYV